MVASPKCFAVVAVVLAFALTLPLHAGAQEKAPDLKTVEEIAQQCKPALAVITVTGRDGKERGLGTGFVVAADGLIATNLHVIGEARPITVLLGGKEYPVVSVHASDAQLDLAVVKIDAKNLPALDLGDSDLLKDGASVVALGHPRGLKHSVVSGVVSARTTIDGNALLQVAIPIESGNSGGPLLDRTAKVQGIVTLRSQVTANLGFAVPVNALKALLKKPNPIRMERWVTIGALNPDEWETVFEGRWRQHSGKIAADGAGAGFGGRSLCLSKRELSPVPFEIAVTMRLDDEAGAGGLVFHADGGDKHYGFYPSNGGLRFVRFEGPDVFSWKILFNEPSPHYKPGEWNALKVRVEKDRMLCYVNDRLVVEAKDDKLTSGKVGLAKFRDSSLEFKNFQVGAKLAAALPTAEVIDRVTKAVAGLDGHPNKALVDKLTPDAPASLTVLRERAKKLEHEAALLRLAADQVHQQRVLAELADLLKMPDAKLDLLHACLLVAKLDNEDLDIAVYRQQVERMARELLAKLPTKTSDKDKLAALSKDLFEERGFHGSRGDFYHRSNSFLNDVLDDREGLPITLSVLYLELASRLGVKVEGIGLPGRFVVQYGPLKGPPLLIDVFEGGKALTRQDAEKRVSDFTGKPARKEDFAPMTKRAILARLIANLTTAAQKENDQRAFLRYQDAIVLLLPDKAEERLTRAAARYRLGDRLGALEDVDYLLEANLPDVDRKKLLDLRRALEKGT